MPLFDRYLIVDWSASKTPKTGSDSIWLGYSDHERSSKLAPEYENNPPTRAKAIAWVKKICLDAISENKKLFIGFDFGFGYPRGAAERMTGVASWRSVWRFMASRFEEKQAAAENRFQIAHDINRDCFGGVSQFWRCPNAMNDELPYLSFDKAGRGELCVPERRHCETSIPRAKSNWELLNPGSVGSQTLLGMACLGRLVEEPELAEKISVWPFDTAFDKEPFKQITLAEVYPSAFTLAYPYEKGSKTNPLDFAQVKTLANGFAALDREDKFKTFLEKPETLDGSALDAVLNEEGWIIGIANQFDVLKNAING